MKGRADSYGLRGVREEKIMGGRKGGVITERVFSFSEWGGNEIL